MKKTRLWMVGGIVVVGGIVYLATSPSRPIPVSAPPVHHHHVAKIPTPPPTKPAPQKAPVIPSSASAKGSVTASFKTATGQAPPAPLQVVALPWQPTTQWAVEPLGMAMHGNALKTLWFGQRTRSGPWQWIPTTLPGVPSTKLPAPIQQTITMAYSLHLGESGPTGTVGNISWQGIQGQVTSPDAWTLSVVGTNSSPLFAPTVGVVVFQKSLTGAFAGYYGMETAYDAHNAAKGLRSLVGFVSRTGSLTTIVQTPPPLL